MVYDTFMSIDLGRAISQRELLSTLAKGIVNDVTLSRLEESDTFIDEAMRALDFEEPRLFEWLTETEPLRKAFEATITSVAVELLKAKQKPLSLDQMARRLGVLTFRIAAATALHAVMNERRNDV